MPQLLRGVVMALRLDCTNYIGYLLFLTHVIQYKLVHQARRRTWRQQPSKACLRISESALSVTDPI